MRKIILSCAIPIGAVLHAANASAQQPEKEVAAAVENLRLAMIDPDSAKLSELVSDRLSYGHSGGHIDDRTSFIQALLTGKSDFVTINLTEQQITVFDNTAIVRHILTADTNDGGKPATVKLSVLLVLQKTGSKWVLIARQAVHV